ncbi:FAD/NAD(P)-binding protein [Streptomyces sp. NPDC044984]|uniref:FAD/NAD(P)-binding protein n=1 Tax=Streptomyces sp. NPDC044984 TaxID=3154335 RepID=UPI0033FA5D9D
MSPTPSAAVLVIVGAGPRATGLLERIAANAPELWDNGRKLIIHLVDPHPPGPGRIWRHGQSPLLRMNSMAEDVTMFTDETSTIEGPVRPGPSLAEWAASFSEGSEAPRHAPHTGPADPDVLAELRTLAGTDFPTRRAQSAYLDWVFRRVLTELPASVTVEWHRTTATAVSDAPDGRQHVRLSGRTAPLRADRVVLAQGHLGSAPTVEHRTRAAFARRHGRFHLPPNFSDDADRYHELFHAHPDRTALSWPEFLTAYDRFGWYSDEMTALTTRAVQDPADRLDFEALDHPLKGLTSATPEAFRSHLRDHIARDVARREDATHSADLGAFLALLSVYGQLPPLVTAGRLTARSVADDLDGWWHGFFSFLASGPPGFRLRQLLALSEAGLVHFLGADLRIDTDETTGTFVATSPTVPGHTVHATALVEAYLPGPNLDRTHDPLLRHLHRHGTLTEEVVSDSTHPPLRQAQGHPGRRPRHRRGSGRPRPASSRSAHRPTAALRPRSPGPAPTPPPFGRTTRWPAPCCDL